MVGFIRGACLADIHAFFEVGVGFDVDAAKFRTRSQHISHTANRCGDRKTRHGDGVKHLIASFR